jgi:hypothetical protein
VWSNTLPRVVVVTRPTEYEGLLELYGTRGQAAFLMTARGQLIEPVETRHWLQQQALKEVLEAIPVAWGRSRISRKDLDRFLFQPADIVIVVGQDGLVANVAKYVNGHPVIGINPDPHTFEGVLVRHPPLACADLLADLCAGRAPMELRSMAEARVDGVETLVALNEIFIGHRSHQSARYELHWGGRAEHQSSSGIVVSTGTGASGWTRSIHRQHRSAIKLPSPTEERLVFFSREPWASLATGVELEEGQIDRSNSLIVRSEMEHSGVLFGDGIEADIIDFGWGRTAELMLSERRLSLIA